MAKWIRWWGLAAFICVTGIVLLFWFFLVDGLVRRAVEKTGTLIVGAEVNVKSADVTFFPLGIALSGIAVTDPSAPSSNSIELGRAAFSLDPLNLLRRKVIINEMSVTGVRFNTPRPKPGFVVKHPDKPDSPRKQPLLSLSSADLPSPRELLAKEPLASVQLVDDASATVRQKRDAWQKRISDLPDKSSIDAYRARIEKLRSASRSLRLSDAGSLLSEANNLSSDIRKDLASVTQIRSAFSEDYLATRSIVDRAMRAPQEDIRKIRDKYGISASGLQNLSHLLFSGTLTAWIDRGVLWYGRLQPLFARTAEKKGDATVVKPFRARGVDVRFRENRPLPDLLVSLVKASLQPAAGTFTGEIRNITPDQDVLGSPLTFSFSGSGLENASAVKISGALDHVRPDAFVDTISLSLSRYHVSSVVLSRSPDLPLTLQDGLFDVSVTGRYEGTRIVLHLDAAANSIRFQTGSQTGLAGAIRAALDKVSSFSLTADISGTPENYEVKISSDLDRILKDAVIKVVGEKAAAFEKELSAAVQARTGDKLKDLQESFGGMGSFGGQIDSVQEQLNKLLHDATSAGIKSKLPF